MSLDAFSLSCFSGSWAVGLGVGLFTGFWVAVTVLTKRSFRRSLSAD